jgi:60kDa lysophospholipase
MTSEAALTKLAYLLARPGANSWSVARDMATSLRGEMTVNHATIFAHPDGTLSKHVTQLTEVAYAVAAGHIEKVKDDLHNDISLLNRADYSGNTLLHLAATGPDVNILRYLLLLGASVHARNYTGSGRTPLFLAANAGLLGHVRLLKQAGAHLHTEELGTATLHAKQRPEVWAAAGLNVLHRQATT